jgi:hypothetical protein
MKCVWVQFFAYRSSCPTSLMPKQSVDGGWARKSDYQSFIDSSLNDMGFIRKSYGMKLTTKKN